jgi:hypothetical protein
VRGPGGRAGTRVSARVAVAQEAGDASGHGFFWFRRPCARSGGSACVGARRYERKSALKAIVCPASDYTAAASDVLATQRRIFFSHSGNRSGKEGAFSAMQSTTQIVYGKSNYTHTREKQTVRTQNPARAMNALLLYTAGIGLSESPESRYNPRQVRSSSRIRLKAGDWGIG